MSVQLDHAVALISALHPTPSTSAMIQITGLGKGAPAQRWFTDAAIAAEYAIEMNTNFRYSVFVSVNPRHAMQSRETDVPHTTALFLDLQPERTNVGNVFAGLAKAGVQPSITVASGNGAHFYFLLNEPTDNESAKLVVERLCLGTGSDRVFNYNRIARLPGSVNFKTPPTLCYLTSVDPGRRYSIQQISAALDSMGIPAVQRKVHRQEPVDPIDGSDWWSQIRERLGPHPLAIIDSGEKNPYSDGQVTRSEADWLVVCALVRAGASDEQITWIYDSQPVGLLKYAEEGAHYLNQTVASARRKLAQQTEVTTTAPRIQTSPRFTGGAYDELRARRMKYAHGR